MSLWTVLHDPPPPITVQGRQSMEEVISRKRRYLREPFGHLRKLLIYAYICHSEKNLDMVCIVLKYENKKWFLV